MAFKLLYTTTSLPQGDFNVDSSLIAEAGMIGIVSGTTVPTVFNAYSGSTGLVGIIDENKTTAFVANVVGETVASGQTTLAHANLVSTSTFSVETGDSSLTVSSATNGTLTAAPSALSGTTTVSYSYYIPGKAGDDTTLASGKCTIWLTQGEYATDQYEVSTACPASSYTIGAKLYISNATGQKGKLTAVAPSAGCQGVAYVTKSPTAGNPFLNFFWVGKA